MVHPVFFFYNQPVLATHSLNAKYVNGKVLLMYDGSLDNLEISYNGITYTQIPVSNVYKPTQTGLLYITSRGYPVCVLNIPAVLNGYVNNRGNSIEVNFNESQSGEWFIYNLIGQKVMKGFYKANNNEILINTNALINGFYIFKASDLLIKFAK